MKKECDCKWCAVLVLIVGILFLLQDYGVALEWWKLEWYTAGFLLLGLKHCAAVFMK